MDKNRIKKIALKKFEEKIKENIEKENYEKCSKLEKLIPEISNIDYNETIEISNVIKKTIEKNGGKGTIIDNDEFLEEIISLEIYSRLTGEDLNDVLDELNEFKWFKK